MFAEVHIGRKWGGSSAQWRSNGVTGQFADQEYLIRFLARGLVQLGKAGLRTGGTLRKQPFTGWVVSVSKKGAD